MSIPNPFPSPLTIEQRLQAVEAHVQSWLSSRWVKITHIAVTVIRLREGVRHLEVMTGDWACAAIIVASGAVSDLARYLHQLIAQLPQDR